MGFSSRWELGRILQLTVREGLLYDPICMGSVVRRYELVGHFRTARSTITSIQGGEADWLPTRWRKKGLSPRATSYMPCR